MTKVSQSDYRAQMWTAEARCLFLKSSPPLDFTIKQADSKLVPIMPSEMFCYQDLSVVMQLASVAASRFSYSTCNCVAWNIRTSPPKPDLRKLTFHEREKATAQSQFMQRFVPVALHEYNIGSNSGLSRSMRELHDKVTSTPHDQTYHILLSDVAIFERVLKVLFCCTCEICVHMYDINFVFDRLCTIPLKQALSSPSVWLQFLVCGILLSS